MDNEELNEALRTLCYVKEMGVLEGISKAGLDMAIDAVIDQIRFRASGSALASKAPA
jgi:hypothetical protein